MDAIVENLPLFDLTLVHFELLLADTSLSDDLLDPVFEFDAGVL